jgi:branched-chain amino acid transport system substrate-binding protein
VQGYDAAQLLAIGLEATKGSVEDEKTLHKAMETAKIDSPRGPISIGANHNVVQNIYLRKVVNGENKVMGIAAENLADNGGACKM